MSFAARFGALAGALILSSAALAADSDDAAQAASAIFESLHRQQYEFVWDRQCSKYLQQRVPKDDFVASMAIGRASLGQLQETRLVNVTQTQSPAGSGYEGTVFVVEYMNAYANGRYVEEVRLIKEEDGKFKLAGIRGKNAPAEQGSPPGTR